eukprot:CAMPEP_0201695870 /NCGR_PEP_ID=MMETSP0578-20130828/7689_1 /ASSEMBLY_ACC=CAM_ASM_000663 /TAXON_ID=267565 /ORGANISM="Skeletonema grethea, Strain CCMP 1804" /LENGTH=487 /DNA_ID=CAMNT_0048181781 /DNA_START=26 /DNA_END=1489 /DNA_ORIENTATION=+
MTSWNNNFVSSDIFYNVTSDGPATHNLSSSQPPPRPQRPFTEYNVFFRLERELLLQGKSDNRDASEQSKAKQNILSSGKEIESSDVSALRPPQYRHLIMPKDWMVVGSSASKVAPSGANPFDRRANDKRKETCTKFTFLELTKLVSSRWREVCQNDPETKDFCKKIADKEAARYREELEEYRAKYGVEAAKGKKRKPRKRKSLQLSKSQKKTMPVKGEGKKIDIDTLNIVVPKLRTEEDPEEDIIPSPALERSSHTAIPDFVNMMYVRQQLQAQLEQSQRRLASLPISSSFTINTFQGIPKDFSKAQMFQGAIIAANPPPDDRYEQGGQILQDGFEMLPVMRQHTSQSFVRRNSAFDSKYDFLNAGDGVIDDAKVEEHLREFERDVFQQLFQSSAYAYEDASDFGVGDSLYLQKQCDRKCIDESRCSPSEVSQFYFENKHNDTREATAAAAAAAPMIKKLRSLQTNDWFQFTENVQIKDAEDIFRDK